ncbi:hypothetical protein PV10_06407 [Exophiala mesophila]|uniref:Zn(2)-C6 fungal-type domain-containing protein n=1 Tax=Exophiala mesophila TaxID=212818 RepID=A0A0D1XUN0_EXOME|nr:uncharacterized protein PV10_06407 [Exophiala mesophila]KIV91916.1 hypothetical protein PV10_06407 [Exophiala mesophila]
MPRPRVKDEDRKRVSRACDTCKRRKEKCDGQHPCLLCKRRGREPECVFSDGLAKRASTSTSTASRQPQDNSAEPEAPSPAQSMTLRDALNESNDAEIAIESLLTLSGSRSAPKSPQYDRDPDALISRAPVPKLARLLRDGRGKFIFVGDSSNLAFVQNIRRLVKVDIGECQLTSDPLRHAMVEVIPPHKAPTPQQAKHPKPSLAEAQDLIKHYLLASSGVIDLFDPDDITDHLCTWTTDANSETDLNSSIYYLVLAIGALARSPADLDTAEFYFSRGREIGVSRFLEDPSVLTVQAYALITFYMLSATRRNGAFMLLGIAVRAAYALGLHRIDISSLFEPRERTARERVWRSLRVLDLYMSGSLGRPPSTSEVDGGSVSWNRSTRDYEDIQMNGRNTSATLRICFIFERILNEVYCRREVSVQLVESISRQYRDWTMSLPTGLQADSLDQKPGSTSPTLRQSIGIAHLKGIYYWSIILLTRPFLIYKVSSKIKNRDEEVDGAGSNVTMTLSEACIDAALRSIEIATDLVHTPGIPRRLFMITNSVFISGIVIGFAIFGNFDKSFPLLSSISQAEAILTIMAKDDVSARRLYTITLYLRLAAIEHIKKRDQIQMQRRRQDIHNIFGDPINKDNTRRSAPSTGDQTPSQPLMDDPAVNNVPFNFDAIDAMDTQPPWQLRFEMEADGRGPVLTTSGALAYTGDDPNGSGPLPGLPQPEFGQLPDNDYLSPDGSGIPSLPSYAEEFPLFSIMTEFDQTADPFAMLGT